LIDKPYTSTPWPLEQRLALFNFLHDSWLKVLLWKKEGQLDKDKVTLYFVKRMRDMAAKHNAKFLFVWLNKGQLFDKFEPKLHESGIASINCEHPRNFIPELRVGGVGHPNGDYHRYVAECISKYLMSVQGSPLLAK